MQRGLVIALVALQVVSWAVYRYAWRQEWWETARIALSVASVLVGLAAVAGASRRARASLLVVVVLLAGQWKVWRPLLWYVVWRLNGSVP